MTRSHHLILLLACVAVSPACRQRALDVPAGTPVELLYPGPELHHARTVQGMAIAFHDAPEASQAAVGLVLPGGFVGEPLPGVAAMTAQILRHAGVLPAPSDPGVPPDVLEPVLEQLGVDMAVSADAEHVVFRLSGPAEHAPLMVKLACGMAFRPQWPDMSLDAAAAELGDLVMERGRGSPRLADEVLWARLFLNQPMGRAAVPDVAALEALSLEDVTAFHASLLDPGHTLLLAAGGDAEAVQNAAEFCAPKRADAAVRTTAPLAPAKASRVHVHVGDAATVHIRVGGRAPPGGTMEAAVMSVAMESLGNGFSSMLVKELRTRRGLVYGVEAMVLTGLHGGVWSVGTSTAPEHAREVVRIMEETLDTVARDGLPDATWRRLAKAHALSFAAGQEVLTELLSVQMEAWMLQQPPNLAWRFPPWLWNLDPAFAAHVAKDFLDPAHRITVVVGAQDLWPPEVPHEVLQGETWDGR